MLSSPSSFPVFVAQLVRRRSSRKSRRSNQSALCEVRSKRAAVSAELLEDRALLAAVLGDVNMHEHHDADSEDDDLLPLDHAYASDGSLLWTAAPVFDSFKAAKFPLEQTFQLNSKPDSNFTVFMDFDGNITENTRWNNGSRPIMIDVPDNVDGSPDSFSTAELERIQAIWQIVAEDFAPFDVNVTTQDPGAAALSKSDAEDPQWGMRVIMTRDTYGLCGCGGIAGIGSFNAAKDNPVYVFNKGVVAAADTASHEVGHALFLSHDGLAAGGATYYRGHGTGDTRWGPIMGASFNPVVVSTWDDGRYFDTTNGAAGGNYGNGPDDLQVISTRNGFGYRADDHGDSRATASALRVTADTELSGFGIIERTTDIDYFSFETGTGEVSLTISPFVDRPNLDVWAGIYDSADNLVAESNPGDVLTASFVNLSLTAGTYTLRVEGVGTHDVYNPVTDTVDGPTSPPWQSNPPNGYSDYASLGQYWISGTRAAPTAGSLAITPVDASRPEGNSGVTTFTFSVSRSGSLNEGVSAEYSVVPSLSNAVGEFYPHTVSGTDFSGNVLPSGSVTFAAGEVSKTVSVEVIGDSVFEYDERFDVVLGNPSAGWSISQSIAAGTIESDETRIAIAPTNTEISVQQEGQPALFGTTLRWRQLQHSGTNTDEWALDNVKLSGSTFVDDFQPDTDSVQWADIQNGTTSEAFDGTDGVGLLMSGSGDRIATSRSLMYAAGDIVEFDLIIGDGFNGGDVAESGDDVALEASFDGGLTWVLVNTYKTRDFGTWTTIREPMPSQEVGTQFVYTLTRSGDSSSAATVEWFVDVGGHADPASAADFVGGILPSGQVTFGVGVTSVDVIVAVDPDAVVETDEFFELHLRNPTGPGAVGLDPAFETARGIILEDDALVSLVTGNNYVLTEGNTGVTSYTFELVRTDRLDEVVDVSWAVFGTGQHPADGVDFVGGQLPAGVVQFDALQTTATVTVEVMTDLEFERLETFDFELLRSSGGGLGTATLSATIVNDDPFPSETAEVRLSLVDLDGRPGIQLGEDFEVDVAFRDLINEQAVLSGYADLLFDPAFFEVTAITYDANYSNGLNGTIDNTVGIVDEVGAGGVGDLLNGDRVFTLSVRALQPGTSAITADVAEAPVSQMFLDDPLATTDQRYDALYGELVIFVDHVDIAPTAFNAVTDHVLEGRTDVTFTLQNNGITDVGAFQTVIVWSPNEILGDADDVLLPTATVNSPGLAAGTSATHTVALMLDRAALFQHSDAAMGPGAPIGTIVDDSSHLFLVVDAQDQLFEADEDNNSGNGHLVDTDDIVYFPWDVDGDGFIKPLDALAGVQAIGTAAAHSDFDGDQLVTPLEVLSTLQRLGYVRNNAVIEASVTAKSSAAAAVNASVQLQSAYKSPVAIQPVLASSPVVSATTEVAFSQSVEAAVLLSSATSEDEEELGLFDSPKDDQQVVLESSTELTAVDAEFAATADWLSKI